MINLDGPGTDPTSAKVMHDGSVIIGGKTIGLSDFAKLVVYFLQNADIQPDDPRLELIEMCRPAVIGEGWNPGGKRICLISRSLREL